MRRNEVLWGLLFVWFCFGDRLSLLNSGCPGTCFENLCSQELRFKTFTIISNKFCYLIIAIWQPFKGMGTWGEGRESGVSKGTGEGSAVKSPCCPCRGPSLRSQYPHDSIQGPITSAPGDLTPSESWRHCTQEHNYMHRHIFKHN